MSPRTRAMVSVTTFLLLSGTVLLCLVTPAGTLRNFGGLMALILLVAPLVLSCCLPVPLLAGWLLLMLWGGSLLMDGADGPGGLGLLFFLSLVTVICFFIMVGRGVIYIVDHAGRGGYRG